MNSERRAAFGVPNLVLFFVQLHGIYTSPILSKARLKLSSLSISDISAEHQSTAQNIFHLDMSFVAPVPGNSVFPALA